MPQRSGLNLNVLTGWLQYQQSHGMTQAQALRAGRQNPNFALFTSAQFTTASYQANKNIQATGRVSGAASQQKLAALFSPKLAPQSMVGVRVLVTVMDRYGNLEERSITVNATGAVTVSQAVAAGLAWAQQTNFGRPGDVQYQARILFTGQDAPQVISTIMGGLQRANVNCTVTGGCQ